jgi:hypothetical protein
VLAAGVGVLCACCLLVLAGHLAWRDGHEIRSSAPSLGVAKRLEIINASRSAAIVRVRLASPDAGVSKVIDLADPIPPGSIQPFWHQVKSPAPSGFCLAYLSASYDNGAEADSRVDLCRDDQALALETMGRLAPSPSHVLSAVSRLPVAEAAAAKAGPMLTLLDFRPDPSQRVAIDVRVSGDGGKAVTLAGHGSAQLWDVAAGHRIAALSAQGPPARAAAFSPDGREIVTLAGDGTLHLWDAATGLELARIVTEHGTSATASAAHTVLRDVVLRADVTETDAPDPPGDVHALLPQRRLRAGAVVRLVQSYGPWSLITVDGTELSYVPADALTQGRGGEALRVSLAPPPKRSEADLDALQRRIGELRSASKHAEASLLAGPTAGARQDGHGSSDQKYAAALDTEAGLAHAANRLAEAEHLYRRVLDIQERALGPCDPAVVRTLANLVRVYRDQGRPDLADPLARRSRSPCTR